MGCHWYPSEFLLRHPGRRTPYVSTRIDGSRGHWDEIEEVWLASELTDDEFEDAQASPGLTCRGRLPP